MTGSTINLSNETGQILNALKTKRRLPSLEATIQWLFASLDAEGKKEIALITDFLALPPPLINIEEVVKEFSYGYVDIRNAKDLVFAKVMAEKINPSDPGQPISKGDISDVIEDLIQEKKDKGLARATFFIESRDIIDHVFNKLIQITKSPMESIIHDKPGTEHGENSKPGKDQDQ